MNSRQRYKIKLSSGRILGPLDLDRVQKLILKNQITGVEVARAYPQGEWQDINLIPEIADILLARASGDLTRQHGHQKIGDQAGDPAQVLPHPVSNALPGATQVLGSAVSLKSLPVLEMPPPTGDIQGMEPAPGGATLILSESDPLPPPTPEAGLAEISEDDEATRVETRPEVSMNETAATSSQIVQLDAFLKKEQVLALPEASQVIVFDSPVPARNISRETTIVFQRPKVPVGTHVPMPRKKRTGPAEMFKATIAAVLLGLVGYQVFLEEPVKTAPTRLPPVRPQLPAYIDGRTDPKTSEKIYLEGIKLYLHDTGVSYRRAAELFRLSASYDVDNVKALAMLASSYLSLIDFSNKDESYFSVISKLIDMTRAKAVDLQETVIADVEFYLATNRPEAAQNRIIEYTKIHTSFDLVLFYYLGQTFYSRGDYRNAATYLNQYADNKVVSPKVFHLRGMVAEKLGDDEVAMREYEKAVRLYKDHARSRLRISALLQKKGRLKEAASHLEFLLNRPNLLAPRELALAYYLHAQLGELYAEWDIALGDMERAVRLDRNDHDYLLELYTLRARAGDSLPSVKHEAQMYSYLSEGEKLLAGGKSQDALIRFMQARQANEKSPIPLVKIGDMFRAQNDLGNARENYKLAADLAPQSIEVWSKFIDVLIQSYEWEEAQKAMDRFRKLSVPQSFIDKLAADMYAKQGLHPQAQKFYRRAMSRDTIDPDVYSAFARSLIATKNFKEAPFYFALALRLDPLNGDAIIGTAKCVAASDSVDRAISLLQDELQKSGGIRAEILAAIADFQIQKGAWEQAESTVEQAKAANPDYALPWKLQAQIAMNKEGQDREAINKALFAYKQFSDRNASDPSGYLERYKLFIRKTEFEKAFEELNNIFARYPKYPNLHFYKGALYSFMGNKKLAAEEYRIELKNNPNSLDTMVALGKELIEQGAYQDALAILNKAMATNSKSADAKHWAGYANFLLKNYGGAVALMNAALLLDKGNPMIYKRLGQTYKEMGNVQGAAQNFRLYLEMDPDAPDRAEYLKYR